MPEVAYRREPRPEEEVRTLAEDLRALLEPPWHVNPEETIPRALYGDESPEGQARLERLKKNKLRKNWFATVLLKIQGALDYLPEELAAVFARQEEELSRRVARKYQDEPRACCADRSVYA